MNFRRGFIMLTAALVTHLSADAQSRDCVGRMELTLPGPAELGASPFTRLFAELEVGSNSYQYEFPDGERTALTDMHYFGQLIISHPVSAAQAMQLQKRSDDRIEKSHDYQAARNVASAITRSVDMITWTSAQYATVFRMLEGHAVYWTGGSDELTAKGASSAFTSVSKAMVFRLPHKVPTGPGVCVPYGFVPDNGKTSRKISIGFRLIAHPDITIYLEDSSATKPNEYTSSRDIAHEMNFFWNQYPRIDYNETIESAYGFPRTRPVTIDRRLGLSSMVRVTREDGTIDYGYMAMVKGDPDAKRDTPNIRYLVLQNNASARSRNIPPVSKTMFLDIAKKVEASIRYRTQVAE